MNVKSRRSGLVRALAVAGFVFLMTVSAAFPAAAKPHVDPDPRIIGYEAPEDDALKAMVEHVFAAKMARELSIAPGANSKIDLKCKDLPVYA